MAPLYPNDPAPCLCRNLEALAQVQPELCERLHWPVEGDHLNQDSDGRWTLNFRGTPFPAGLTNEELATALTGIDPGSRSTHWLIGVGLGELLAALMERAPKANFIAWERDPWLLRHAISHRDWSSALTNGQLRFAMNADLAILLESGSHAIQIEHPLLARIYSNEIDLVHNGVGPKRALVCCGTLFVDSLSKSLREQGFSVMSLDSQRISKEEIDQVFHSWKPDLVAAINGIDGLAEDCETHGVPHICWEIDPTLNGPSALEIRTPNAHIFTYRKRNVAAFVKAGYPHVSYLPLAADPDIRKPQRSTPEQIEHYGARVSFVGASLLENYEPFKAAFLADLQAWQGGTEHQALEVMRKLAQLQQADYSQYSIPEWIDKLCPGFRAQRMTLGSCDPALHLAEISAAEKRLNYIAALAPHSPVVWGDPGWTRIEPHGVLYKGPALHETELPLIYGNSQINVDVGRLYQDDIITMRIFDILACGGFVLAEHSQALAELFEVGVEVASYKDLRDLQHQVAYYLMHPEKAKAIALRGRQAVLERHTINMRVAHMLGEVDRTQHADTRAPRELSGH